MEPGRISYKRRLIGIVSLMLAVGFVGTSIASYLVSRTSLRHEIVATGLPLTSDNIYSEVQKDLLRPVFISSMMASDTFLRDWALSGESDVEAIAKYLKTIKTKYHAFSSFFVSEKTRRYYHSEGVLKEVREDEPRDAWYFRLRKLEIPYETNVDPDMANRDAMTVFINYRVLDYQGNLLGATGVGLTIDEVLSRVQDYQTRYGRRICFVDPEGKVTVGNNTRLPSQEILQEFLARSRSERGDSFDEIIQGKLTYLNVRFIPELNWYLVVTQTEEDTTRGIWNTFLLNLLICCLITGGIVTATAYTIGLYQERLEHMASFDKLTGLLNRQAFAVVLQQTLHDVDRTQVPLSALLMDIDLFKNVNDEFGHPAGDRVLEGVADAIRRSLRKGDPCCRWGGEEFLVLLRDCDLQDATRLATKLQDSVSSFRLLSEAPDLRVTLSLGITRYHPGEAESAFIARADKALYKAKAAGRSRTEIIA